MDWFTASNLINCIVVLVAYGVKRELCHISDTIRSVKESIDDAKTAAQKAHERIDVFFEQRRL